MSDHRAAGVRSPLANRAIGGSVCIALFCCVLAGGQTNWQSVSHDVNVVQRDVQPVISLQNHECRGQVRGEAINI